MSVFSVIIKIVLFFGCFNQITKANIIHNFLNNVEGKYVHKIIIISEKKNMTTTYILHIFFLKLDSEEEYYDEYDNTGKIFSLFCLANFRRCNAWYLHPCFM